jgi:hypothetical protein
MLNVARLFPCTVIILNLMGEDVYVSVLAHLTVVWNCRQCLSWNGCKRNSPDLYRDGIFKLESKWETVSSAFFKRGEKTLTLSAVRWAKPGDETVEKP